MSRGEQLRGFLPEPSVSSARRPRALRARIALAFLFSFTSLSACETEFLASDPAQLFLTEADPTAWADSLRLMDTVRLTLRLLDTSGQEVTGPEILFASSASGVVSISASGPSALLTAETLGSATITASVDDPRFVVERVTREVVVREFDIDWPDTVNVTAIDTAEVRLSGRFAGSSVTWRSSNEGVLRVTQLSGAGGGRVELQASALGQADLILRVSGRNLPTQEIDLRIQVNQRWRSVSAGLDHSCALDVDGIAYCWGSNFYGELGTGSYTGRTRPTLVATSLKFDALDAGGFSGGNVPPQAHTCAALGPLAYCWGSFISNQLGDGSGPCFDIHVTASCTSTLPVRVDIGGPTSSSSISVGGRHGCALVLSNPPAARCWGFANGGGTERLGTPGPGYLPGSAGGEHACYSSFTFGPEAVCSGRNDAGQLGDGTTTDRITGDVGGTVKAGSSTLELHGQPVHGGGRHSCALLPASPRDLRCWGSNSHGQLGPAGPGPTANPCPAGACSRTAVAVPIGVDVAAIALGALHSCVLSTAGAAYCWGSNQHGQLGVAPAGGTRPTPTLVAGGHLFSALAAGDGHTCGIDRNGSLYCWGRNGGGQLGTGTTSGTAVPMRVIEPLLR